MKCTENILTLGIGKTRFMLAIGVLFIALGNQWDNRTDCFRRGTGAKRISGYQLPLGPGDQGIGQ